jgi:hypothetical protein
MRYPLRSSFLGSARLTAMVFVACGRQKFKITDPIENEIDWYYFFVTDRSLEMRLNETVMVAIPEGRKFVWHPATVVGRTLEAEPHYDVRLEGGKIIANVAEGHLRVAETSLRLCG